MEKRGQATFFLQEAACPGVVSFTGGGGKTSLMFQLARELAAAGKKVLTTTTTRIYVPTADQSRTVLLDPDPLRVLEQAARIRDEGHVTAAAGLLPDERKLKGFGPEDLRTLQGAGLFDWILVEADGARGRPLKAPADHEPVIPPNTTVHVAVMGLEVVGARLSDDLVFRSELAGRRMGLYPGAEITEEALVRLIVHPEGFFKSSPENAHRVVFLNKADDPWRRTCANYIAGLLREVRPAPGDRVLVGETREALRIHAMHHLERPR